MRSAASAGSSSCSSRTRSKSAPVSARTCSPTASPSSTATWRWSSRSRPSRPRRRRRNSAMTSATRSGPRGRGRRPRRAPSPTPASLLRSFAAALAGDAPPHPCALVAHGPREDPGGHPGPRYLGQDKGDYVVALYLQPTEAAGAEQRIRERLRELGRAGHAHRLRPPRRIASRDALARSTEDRRRRGVPRRRRPRGLAAPRAGRRARRARGRRGDRGRAHPHPRAPHPARMPTRRWCSRSCSGSPSTRACSSSTMPGRRPAQT